MTFNPDKFESEEDAEPKFKPVEEFEDLENIEAMAIWFRKEVEEYVDRMDDGMLSHHFEIIVANLVRYLASKKGIKIEDVNVESVNTHYGDDSYGETTAYGNVELNAKEIVSYMSPPESGSQITEWNIDNLKKVFEEMFGLEESVKVEEKKIAKKSKPRRQSRKK